MKVIIAGSRVFDDTEAYYQRIVEGMIERFEKEHGKITSVVSGTARGVDRIGEAWATKNNIPIHRFTPDWKKQGNSAGLIRNVQMGEFGDSAIILWDGKSRGTKHMRDVMRNLDKPFLLDILEPIHYNYEHTPRGTIEQFLGKRPKN
jgi:hypothetical protein